MYHFTIFGGMKTLPVRLPEELHRVFKAKTAMNGENMNTVIVRLIESYVQEGKTKTKSVK